MNARWRMNQLLIFTSMPLLDSYVTIGIKKTCFTSRVRERQKHKLNDSSEQKWENKPRSSMNRNLLLWLGKEKKWFYRRIFFCGYPCARQPIASYLSEHKLFEMFKSYSWSHDKMLIDCVKSFIIPIYTHEVTAFPRLEIFVKHRSLYDNLARYVTNKNSDENSQSSLRK